MTTQTERMQMNQPIQTQVKKSNWLFVLAAVMILSLVGGAALLNPTAKASQAGSNPGLEAISARYQGMADAYAPRTSQTLTVISDRYQGMLDVHTAGQKAQTLSALAAISNRYQAQADLITRGPLSESMQALTILSDRYQALADR